MFFLKRCGCFFAPSQSLDFLPICGGSDIRLRVLMLNAQTNAGAGSYKVKIKRCVRV